MPSNVAHTAEVQDSLDTAPVADRVRSAGVNGMKAEARQSATKDGTAGRGFLGSIRVGIVGIVEILSWYRSLMAEIDRMGQKKPAGDKRSDTGSRG